MLPVADPWDAYRKRRNLVWFAFLAYVPFCFLVAFVSFKLFSTFKPAFVFAFAWMLFYLVAGNLLIRFRCPRCGKPFFAKWWYHNMFAQCCVHCGLRKYADRAHPGDNC
jgi:hypothetical protein